jgi:hypothetical protein
MPSTTISLSTGINNDLQQYDSQASLNNDVISATPAKLSSLIARNKSSSLTLFLMLFDATAVPVAPGTTPKMMPIPIPPGLPATLDATEQGVGNPGIGVDMPFTSGIVWAASTTPDTLTVDTTNSIWVTARFSK